MTVVVLPTTMAPATRVAFSGTTKDTLAAADVAAMYVVSPAFVAVTLHVPARLAVSAFPDKVQPADEPAARAHVTGPVPVPPEIASLNTVPTFPLSVRTVTVACGVPTEVVCAAAVSVRVESVAVSTHVPVALMLSALKVATPAAATPVVVPPSAQFEVIAIVSVDPVPEVTTFPFTSSTAALNVARTVEATVSVVGGAVVKPTWVAAPADTAITVLVPVASVLVASVATSWQLLPVLMATVVKVATPATAVALVVPVNVHVEVRAIMSVDPVPDVIGMPLLSSTETANDGRAVPAATAAAGSVVKPTSAGVVVASVTVLPTAVTPTFVVSLAVRVHAVPLVKLTEENVATPAIAAVLNVPARTHPAVGVVSVIVSVADVSTFPY